MYWPYLPLNDKPNYSDFIYNSVSNSIGIIMSHTEKYLVTSATGKTGYQVALQLLANGRNVLVVEGQ